MTYLIYTPTRVKQGQPPMVLHTNETTAIVARKLQRKFHEKPLLIQPAEFNPVTSKYEPVSKAA